MAAKFLLLLTCLGVYSCDGMSMKIPKLPKQPSPSLYDDIRLTPAQEQEMKERGIISNGKWPRANGVATVPYYFDTDYFPPDHFFRTLFRFAAEMYKNQTCIEWVEVNATDSRHKVRLMAGGGCFSGVGISPGAYQDLSLPDGCYEIGTILHEMAHTVGLFHTQSRGDRDSYVKPWYQNVKPGLEHNFYLEPGDNFGIPYDYKSIMHYGNDYFTSNGSFTLTTVDPFALFSIGARLNDFRFSDVALLNRGYNCIAEFTKRCGEKNCQNKGFVGKDCKCRCPENTSGERCETLNGPLFADKPKCGGVVTTETDLTPNGYPRIPTKDKCIFNVQAPKCKVPAFTITEAKFYWTICAGNILALEVSDKSFGYTWCDQSKIPLGKTIVSETQNATLYFSTQLNGWREYGFRAKVTFVRDPACDPTTPTTTRTTTTIATTTTLRTSAPSPGCVLTETSTNNFEYKTLNFTSDVSAGTRCNLIRYPPSAKDLVFTKIEVNFKGANSDYLELRDPSMTISIGETGSSTIYSLWPMEVNYRAQTAGVKGFQINVTPVTNLPAPCNGEEITLVAGTPKTISNPLISSSTKDLRCAFKVTAPAGKKILVKPTKNDVFMLESLRVVASLPDSDTFRDIGKRSVTSTSNIVKVYYNGLMQYSSWTLEFSVK